MQPEFTLFTALPGVPSRPAKVKHPTTEVRFERIVTNTEATHMSEKWLLTFGGQVLPNRVSLACPEPGRRNPCRIQQFG